jgi:hypothetical protein
MNYENVQLFTMEFYSAIKKNEILSFAGKWMELENIILSEVSQIQKQKITYVEHRSSTNTSIILHTYKYTHIDRTCFQKWDC